MRDPTCIYGTIYPVSTFKLKIVSNYSESGTIGRIDANVYQSVYNTNVRPKLKIGTKCLYHCHFIILKEFPFTTAH